MAIINTTFGFVFVHVPKSAGTSVTSVLSGLCTILDIEIGGSSFGEAVQSAYLRRHGISKHSSARELRTVLGEQLWLKYVSFGVVRHPLDRLASAYRFLRQWNSPQNRLLGQMIAFQSFADFVASDVWIEAEGPDRIFRPQAFWLADAHKDEILVDRVLHTETLNTDLQRLLLDLGIPRAKVPIDVPQLNSTRKTDQPVQLSGDLLERVRTRYARDLRMFGYSLESDDKAARTETVTA